MEQEFELKADISVIACEVVLNANAILGKNTSQLFPLSLTRAIIPDGCMVRFCLIVSLVPYHDHLKARIHVRNIEVIKPSR